MQGPGTAWRVTAGLLALGLWLCVSLAAATPFDDETQSDADSIAGRLLVASERMDDPNFARTVIYMVEHDREGAFGLVVNRPLGALSVADLLAHMGRTPPAEDATLEAYLGGPVSPGQGFFLHSHDVMLETSVAVDDEIAVTGDPAMLSAIAEGRRPQRLLFALGYAGWGPGQLESEMSRGVWFDIPAEAGLIFAANPAESWAQALTRREIEL